MPAAAAIIPAVLSFISSMKKQPPQSGGMPGQPFQMGNASQDAMGLQQTNAAQPGQQFSPMSLPQEPLPTDSIRGLVQPPPENYAEKVMSTNTHMDQIPTNDITQNPTLPEQQAGPLQTVSSSFTPDSNTWGNAAMMAQLGGSLGQMFKGPPPPGSGGFPAHSFQMPNSTQSLASLLMRRR